MAGHYFHGSATRLEPGAVLTGWRQRTPAQQRGDLSACPEVAILERHRPADKLSLLDAVFLVRRKTAIDDAGAANDYRKRRKTRSFRAGI